MVTPTKRRDKMKNETILTRDFRGEMKSLFNRYPIDTPPSAPEEAETIPKPRYDTTEAVTVPIDAHRFNVVKQTDEGAWMIEFGITLADVLRGVDGRFRDREGVKFRVIPAEVL